jgi:uncharacterized GH25 family protein
MIRRSRAALAAAVFVTATAALSAHDFWIEPSTFTASLDETIGIHLRVGEHFAGEKLARNGRQIEKFVVSGPSGEKPVVGRDGMDPAGLLRLDAPGLWFVGYRSKPSRVELAADKFEQYLREEGLERIIDARAKRQESRMPGRERFSRSVKSLIRTTGDPGGKGFDKTLGLTLELVLEADPALAKDGRLPVRLLHDGRPLAGTLVVAYKKETSAAASAEALRARTDKDGRVVVGITPGLWLLKAVHMDRAMGAGDVDWESVWTSLTFKVG